MLPNSLRSQHLSKNVEPLLQGEVSLLRMLMRVALPSLYSVFHVDYWKVFVNSSLS
jgi:hypothetical protein